MNRFFTLVALTAGFVAFGITTAHAQVFTQSCCPPCQPCQPAFCQPAYCCPPVVVANRCCPMPCQPCCQPAMAFHCQPIQAMIVQRPLSPCVTVFAQPVCPPMYTGFVPSQLEQCLNWCDQNFADPDDIFECRSECHRMFGGGGGGNPVR